MKHCSTAIKLHWVQLAQGEEGNLVVHVVVETALIPHCNSSTHLQSFQSEDSPGDPRGHPPCIILRNILSAASWFAQQCIQGSKDHPGTAAELWMIQVLPATNPLRHSKPSGPTPPWVTLGASKCLPHEVHAARRKGHLEALDHCLSSCEKKMQHRRPKTSGSH